MVDAIAPVSQPVKDVPLAPAAAPAAPAATAPVEVVAPAAPAPAVDPTPAAIEPVAPVEPKEGDAPAADPAAPAPDAAPDAEGDKGPTEETKTAAPAYTEFKLPEGLKAEPALMSAYANVLGKYGISQEAGQELIDFHANAIKQASADMAQKQQDVFAETRKGWVNDFYKQAGNRRDTLLNDAKFAVTEVIKDKKEREAFWNVLSFTGAGDHPANIMAWAKVGKRLREGSSPAQGLPNGAKGGSPADRRYTPKN